MKEVTMTPELIADMTVDAFIKSCETNNVGMIKLMGDLCGMGIVNIQATFAQVHDMAMKKYSGRNVEVGKEEDFAQLIQLVANLGVKIGELNLKQNIAVMYYSRKTPDCFKKEDMN